jgi:hypothetical protein
MNTRSNVIFSPGVTEIAMESAGQYWRPVWNLLEGEFAKVLLVNPQHIKGLNGYKTEFKDAHWIADLLEGGKLRGSWIPPRAIRELRDLTRQRVRVLEDLNRAKNRIEQLCQAGNIKVSSVATDLFGVSGHKMLALAATVEGNSRRMYVRKGGPKAVMALAYHMMGVVYQILSRGKEYVKMGGDSYDRQNKPKVVAKLVKRLLRLGYYVQLQEAELPPEEPEAKLGRPEAAAVRVSATNVRAGDGSVWSRRCTTSAVSAGYVK